MAIPAYCRDIISALNILIPYTLSRDHTEVQLALLITEPAHRLTLFRWNFHVFRNDKSFYVTVHTQDMHLLIHNRVRKPTRSFLQTYEPLRLLHCLGAYHTFD